MRTNDVKHTIVFQKNWEAIHALNEDGTRKYRYIINEGSSRSSKTYSLIDCFDYYCRDNDNKRLTVWRDTKVSCKKTVLNDALKRFKTTNRYKQEQQFNKTESIFLYDTQSTFEIHGTDDEESVHGLTQDAAWVNEPYSISLETFNQIDQRTSDFFFIDWNPKKNHWIEDIKRDPRTLVIHSTYKDNPFCPIEQKTKIESYQPVKLSDIVVNGLIEENEAKAYDIAENPLKFTPKQIRELTRCQENEEKRTANDFNWYVYGLGLKAEKPNRIFNWNEITLDEYRKLSTTIYIGVDWGAVDPWGILEAKYIDGCLYLHELNYDCENEVRAKLNTTELQQIRGEEEGIVTFMFKKLGIGKNNEVICDSNRPEKISTLRRNGWRAKPADKGAGSILSGIDLLQNLNVYFTSTSENLKYEQENYTRKVDHSGYVLEEPEDKDNHLIDPARYIVDYLRRMSVIKKI